MGLYVRCDCDECGVSIDDGEDAYCSKCYKKDVRLRLDLNESSLSEDLQVVIAALGRIVELLKKGRR